MIELSRCLGRTLMLTNRCRIDIAAIEFSDISAPYALAVTELTVLVQVDENTIVNEAAVIGAGVGNIGKIVHASDPNFTLQHNL